MKTPEEFWSIENMEKHVDRPYGRLDMTVVGERIFGLNMDHKIIYLMDPKGRGWYETRILSAGAWVTPEEKIFGRKQKRRPA